VSDQEKSWLGIVGDTGLKSDRGTYPGIMQVEYRRLKTFGNDENETIGAVVEVPRGQDPDAILSALKEWVDARLNGL
jgi:hypothetical protein